MDETFGEELNGRRLAEDVHEIPEVAAVELRALTPALGQLTLNPAHVDRQPADVDLQNVDVTVHARNAGGAVIVDEDVATLVDGHAAVEMQRAAESRTLVREDDGSAGFGSSQSCGNAGRTAARLCRETEADHADLHGFPPLGRRACPPVMAGSDSLYPGFLPLGGPGLAEHFAEGRKV